MKISIVNGPNLNLLGTREPEIYGNDSFDNFLNQMQLRFPEVVFDYFQSNIEGEIIDKLQNCKDSIGIVLNAAAYSHTSVAIGDAVAAIQQPVIEVHISNTFSRESFRHHSFVSPNAQGVISGLGLEGYVLAIQYLIEAKNK